MLFSSIKMGFNMKVVFLKIIGTGWANFFTKIRLYIQANGNQESLKGKERCFTT